MVFLSWQSACLACTRSSVRFRHPPRVIVLQLPAQHAMCTKSLHFVCTICGEHTCTLQFSFGMHTVFSCRSHFFCESLLLHFPGSCNIFYLSTSSCNICPSEIEQTVRAPLIYTSQYEVTHDKSLLIISFYMMYFSCLLVFFFVPRGWVTFFLSREVK